ncbi:glycosyltransferase [Aeromonas veronii]|uniref:glycosyltransferase n=1 Tax=Aeromonas veronii TaxID=654 RepID=UPI0030053868
MISDLDNLVSVILPVYNCERFIGQAIESILNQTYKNLELIVIDDGSNDDSLSIINSYKYDVRLMVISRENKGLVFSLNEGISLANGKYIARMDADDISIIDRIEKQVSFFKRNNDVAILGSRTILIDESNQVIGRCHRPLSDIAIKSYFFYGSPLAHPSIMYNLNILSKDEVKYLKEDYPAEDLGLFLRVSRKHKIYNIKEPLLKYRVTASGISNTNKRKQQDKSSQLRVSHFSGNEKEVNFVLAIDRDTSLFSYFRQLTTCLVTLLFVCGVNNEISISIMAVYIKALRRKILKI